MDVVIVESPAKAKTINKYLGSGYHVLASYGHIRDLPSKDGSVRPDEDFAMDWEVDAKAQKHITAIAKAVKGADHLYLATDPDREGEAISWHIREILEKKNALKDVDVKRVVFNEITKKAVVDAFHHPRDLDEELIDAYLARRALDYLVGFTLSPVLWRKLPGSRSAGRVQSVALRLVCEREAEIENFISEEYWSVKATFATAAGDTFDANLTHLNGDKLDKMSLRDEASARAAVRAIEAADFAVASIERKKARRNPAPPFTTSTLQQEASRKLNFSAKRTMQVAQRLYEGVNIGGETVGLITYMRTDGVQMAGEAIAACRGLIGERYGARYVPQSPRIYKTKAKNAQEAHEAIRPTDVNRRIENLRPYLDEDQRKLYSLIWQRTVASQMESAVLDQVAVDVASRQENVVLRATGSVIAFDGFLRLYQEGRDERRGDDAEDDDRNRILPPMSEGDALERRAVDAEQHFTQPPPRYSEASLVKKLEELGIGRPSTYASILSVLQDRNYVKLEKRRFEPEDRGRLVTAFLTSFFTRYVEYGFTADLEEKLDDISGGRIDWKKVLEEFWGPFNDAVAETKDLRVREVLDALDTILGPHFFRPNGSGRDPRACPACADGRLSLKLGKFGAFIGCSNYPECRHTRPLAVTNGDEPAAEADTGPRLLGTDPETGLDVTLRKGPYGHYVQLGEAEKGSKAKPKRSSLARNMSPADMDLDKALALLSLPREVGVDPETGQTITAAIGRFGPYIKLGGTYVSLKGDDDVLTIGLNRAVVLLADAPKKAAPVTLGDHPKSGKPITLREGRWGPYVQAGAVRANVPKGTKKEDVTLEMAIAALDAKSGNGKSAAKKPAARKGTAKKPAAKKKAASDA
ncbi:MAG: type I DNA topoisomerase [Hyphomicrobiales bacterium]|nr:type I DNA topoisomerase [Hyphomicrobiales bacterium]MCP5370772.1 type I DNA topoisomerase [Hyphomicrobiales bacterium]